jgi:molybdopterin converting factor small subunit
MKLQIKLFAVAQQLAGCDEVEIEVGNVCNVAAARAALLAACPQLNNVAEHLAFAVDTEYATDTTPIFANAEVAVIPPVSGG